jgi:tetratricopeptide (TPR) repeat protein
MHGHVTEARRWLRRALDVGPDEPSESRAKVLDGAGYLAADQGETDNGLRLVEASVACAREVGATATAALAAAHLCGIWPFAHEHRSDPQGALAAGDEAVALALEAGDDFARATALNNLGHATHQLFGDRQKARAYYEQSLDVRRQIGDVSRIALSLNNLGWTAFLDGDLDRAKPLFAESIEVARGIGDKRHVRAASGGLAWIAYVERRWDEAESFARESLRLNRELGMRPDFLDPIFCLAGIAAATGDPSRAARLAAAAALHLSLIGFAAGDDAGRYEEIVASTKATCDPETFGASLGGRTGHDPRRGR